MEVDHWARSAATRAAQFNTHWQYIYNIYIYLAGLCFFFELFIFLLCYFCPHFVFFLFFKFGHIIKGIIFIWFDRFVSWVFFNPVQSWRAYFFRFSGMSLRQMVEVSIFHNDVCFHPNLLSCYVLECLYQQQATCMHACIVYFAACAVILYCWWYVSQPLPTTCKKLLSLFQNVFIAKRDYCKLV